MLNGTLSISVTRPNGKAVKFDPRTIDHAKVDAALRSRMDKVLPQSQLGDFSFDFEDGRISISLETGTQAYQERDGWLVGRSGPELVSEGTKQEKALPLPGMHFRGAGHHPLSRGGRGPAPLPGQEEARGGGPGDLRIHGGRLEPEVEGAPG